MKISSLSKCLIKLDNACDYIPVVSTVINLVDVFQKSIIIPLLQKSSIKDNHYYRHLSQKSFARSIILLLPVLGNVLIGLLDFYNREFDNEEFMLDRLERTWWGILEASARLKDDKEFMLKACKIRNDILRHASEWLRDDDDVVLAAVAKDGNSLFDASSHLQKNKKIVIAAANNGARNYDRLNGKLQMDKDVVLAYHSYGYHGNFSEIIKKMGSDADINFIIDVVTRNPFLYFDIDPSLKDDETFMIEMCKQDHLRASDASDRLKDDKNFMLSMIPINDYCIVSASDRLKDDEDFMFAVIKIAKSVSGVMEYTSDRLKGSAGLMLAAIELDADAICCAKSNLNNDLLNVAKVYSLLQEALRQCPEDERDDFKRLALSYVDLNYYRDSFDQCFLPSESSEIVNQRFAIFSLLPLFAQIDRNGDLVEQLFEVMKDCTIDDQRKVILKMITFFPKMNRAEILKKTVPLIKDITSLYQKISILVAASFIPPNYVETFVLEAKNQTFPNVFGEVHYLYQALSVNTQLREETHQFLQNRLSSLADKTSAYIMAKYIIDFSESFLLTETDPLFQEAINKLILTSEDTQAPKNPYTLFSKLSQLPQNIPADFKMPSIIIEGEAISLSSETFLKAAQQEQLTYNLLPNNIDIQALKSLFQNLDQRIATLSADKKQATLKYINETKFSKSRDPDAKIEDNAFEILKQNFINDAFIRFLLTIGGPHQTVPIQASRLFSIMKYITDLSNELSDGDYLSPQEEALLYISTSIQECPGGKSEGITLVYSWLLKDAKITSLNEKIAENEFEIGSLGKKYIDQLVQALLHSTFSNIEMLKKLTNSADNDISQLSHQSIFLKNLIGQMVGLQHTIQFDAYTGLLFDSFFVESLEITQKKVLHTFYSYFTPQKLVETLVRDSKIQAINDLQAMKDTVDLQAKLQVLDEGRVGLEEIDEATLKEISKLKKQIKEIRGAEHYFTNLNDFYRRYLKQTTMAKPINLLREINSSDLQGMSKDLKDFTAEQILLPYTLTEEGAKELLKAAGYFAVHIE